MTYSQQQLNAIFEKTDGQCHICREVIALKKYGILQTLGAWEVDHSVPQAKGGTNRLRNLLPACVHCNRSKQDSSTKTARGKHGFRAAPLSREEKTNNALLGWCMGGVAGRILFMPFGVPGIIFGALLGSFIGYRLE